MQMLSPLPRRRHGSARDSRRGPIHGVILTMSLTAAAATFLAVLPAELPDKTILACLILSGRSPGPWLSSAAPPPPSSPRSFIGVAAGGAISLLPRHAVEAAAAAAFVIGAVLLLAA